MPRSQRHAHRPELASLLPAGDAHCKAQRDATRRDASISEAYFRHGDTLVQIARHVGLHYATVSRIANGSVHQYKT